MIDDNATREMFLMSKINLCSFYVTISLSRNVSSRIMVLTKSNQCHINSCNNCFSDQWSDAMWNMTWGRGGTNRQHRHRESRVWWAMLHNGPYYYKRYKGIRDYEWSLRHKHNCTTHAPLWYKPEFLDLRPPSIRAPVGYLDADTDCQSRWGAPGDHISSSSFHRQRRQTRKILRRLGKKI